MSSSLGTLFHISTWGESHGIGVGVVIDGCPPRIPLSVEDIQAELDRRRPGQSKIVTPRKEDDKAEILSGVLDGLTLGTPIGILVRNTDHYGKTRKLASPSLMGRRISDQKWQSLGRRRVQPHSNDTICPWFPRGNRAEQQRATTESGFDGGPPSVLAQGLEPIAPF